MLNITRYDNDKGGKCAECRKGDTGKPILAFVITGRSYQDRQFMELHEDCLNRRLKSLAGEKG